ncbi:MAG: hypothetical protein FWE48_07520 [Coriobacteriia bacterium]|nr:hypothetical protein [Coriobacteriia bacterium]
MLTRPEKALIEINKRYPKFGRKVDLLREGKGRLTEDWPEDVLLPHGAWMGIGEFYSGSPEYTDFMAKVAMATEAMEFAAVGTWKYSKDIYRFDPDVFKALIETPLSDTAPLKIFRRLPSWSVYIEYPEMRGPDYGVYCHLDYEYRSGAWELRLTHDSTVGAKATIPIELSENITIEEAIARHSKEASDEHSDTELSALYKEIEVIAKPEITKTIKADLSLLMYICSEQPEIINHANPSTQPSRLAPKKVKGGMKLFEPSGVRIWHVGDETGKAIRTSRSAKGEGGKKAPHIRRAHWHGYWKGPRDGERTFDYRWLAPIAVNVDSEGK